MSEKRPKTKILFESSYEMVYGDTTHHNSGPICIREAQDPKFGLNDLVKAKGTDFIYANYRAMAVALKLLSINDDVRHWSCGIKNIKNAGMIINFARHQDESQNIYAVKEVCGNIYLIGERGLVLVEKGSHLEKELFEI